MKGDAKLETIRSLPRDLTPPAGRLSETTGTYASPDERACGHSMRGHFIPESKQTIKTYDAADPFQGMR